MFILRWVVWSLIFSLVNMSKDRLSVTPEMRIGLDGLDPRGMKLLACAFLVYPAIKFQHLEEIPRAHSDADPLPIMQHVLRLADFHLDFF